MRLRDMRLRRNPTSIQILTSIIYQSIIYHLLKKNTYENISLLRPSFRIIDELFR
ncbi:hypothetical protein QF004_002364 [Chryseobacterium sp. MDT2-18]|nr:hypothetical protein [Chryseobacterium sp. MDT2-18]